MTKSVSEYVFSQNSFFHLKEIISDKIKSSYALCILDGFFEKKKVEQYLKSIPNVEIKLRDSSKEPSTDEIDDLMLECKKLFKKAPDLLIAVGGGSVLDTAKALSNLFTNPGQAEEYQGWDLLKKPGVFKIGIPTISGTGAEASRTCVLLNKKKNIKMGMNSDYSCFDRLILDPKLTLTVPRQQYFFTGMDTYIHCVESLRGSYRHPIADAYSREALRLCREVFFADNMQSEENRIKLMTASFLGGSAIANSYVGLVHPLSAALSVVFHSHHCVSNCMVMRRMRDFYPEESAEFLEMLQKQKIEIPKINQKQCGQNSLSAKDLHEKLREAAMIHEKPLRNALGENYKNILSKNKTREIFSRILC